MKFKGTEDRKKRVLNTRRTALENDVTHTPVTTVV